MLSLTDRERRQLRAKPLEGELRELQLGLLGRETSQVEVTSERDKTKSGTDVLKSLFSDVVASTGCGGYSD